MQITKFRPKKKQKLEQQKKIKDEEKRLIEEWGKTRAEPIKIRSFEIPQHYIRMCCRGLSNLLIIESEAGLGKTFMVLNTARQEKKEFAYLNSKITELAFFKFIYKNRNKLVILDDTNILNNDIILNLLMGMCWESNGKRIINWVTTSPKLGDVPETFEFKGQIIILTNKTTPKIEVLKTRGNYYKLQFSYREKISIMKSIAKKPYKDLSLKERKFVLKKLIEKTDETSKNFNFRTLMKAYNFFIYNRKKFDVLLDNSLEKDFDLEVIKKLGGTGLTVKEQVDLFKRITGKGRSIFFEKKKQLKWKIRDFYELSEALSFLGGDDGQ